MMKRVEVDLAGWQSSLSDVVIRPFCPNSQASLRDQLPRTEYSGSGEAGAVRYYCRSRYQSLDKRKGRKSIVENSRAD